LLQVPPQPTVRWALFGFGGRIGRQTFILGQLFMLALFAIVIARILAVRGNDNETVFWGLAFLALCAASLWSIVALTVKRLHDLGLPALMTLLLAMPTINVIFIIVLMFLRSDPATNQHGPPPFGDPDERP
jgi:uncharacterized membrane protein YhaH (DUF805 family)